jgi:hypothetical protein
MEVAVPAPHPIEFRQRAVELARKGEDQLRQELGHDISTDFGS